MVNYYCCDPKHPACSPVGWIYHRIHWGLKSRQHRHHEVPPEVREM